MAVTTTTQFSEFMQSQPATAPWQVDRIPDLLDVAEDELFLAVGWDFSAYDARATRLWVYATCVIAERLLAYEDPSLRNTLGQNQGGVATYDATGRALIDPIAQKPWLEDPRLDLILPSYKAIGETEGITLTLPQHGFSIAPRRG